MDTMLRMDTDLLMLLIAGPAPELTHSGSSSQLDLAYLWLSLCLCECFQAPSSPTVFYGGWARAFCLLVPQHLAQCLAHSELSVPCWVWSGCLFLVGGCSVETRVSSVTPVGKLAQLFSVEKEKESHEPGSS